MIELKGIKALTLAKVYFLFSLFTSLVSLVFTLLLEDINTFIQALIQGVMSLLMVFIMTLLFALLYNFIADKVGGIKVTLKEIELENESKGEKQMFELKKIDTKSLMKVYAVFSLIFSVLFALIILFGSMITGDANFVAMVFFMPILYVIFGTIAAAIIAVLYNFIANKFGGVEFQLEELSNDSIKEEQEVLG